MSQSNVVRGATAPPDQRTTRQQPAPRPERLNRLSSACIKSRQRNGNTGLLRLLRHFEKWQTLSGEDMTEQLAFIESEISSVCSRALDRGIAVGIEIAFTEKQAEA